MSIWKKTTVTPEQLNQFASNSIIEHLNIKISEIGDDYISATMPVENITRQPLGFLHGGASVVLAETLGSLAGYLAVEGEASVFGVEINANHLRSVKEGVVTGTARPIRIGRSIQVWDIRVADEQGEAVCVSRLTTVVK
ncbi:1,4-dihydroxy-2-naphthoyl-CoA hydrolase [Alteromonadaceae bacterium Bs31]|nr:1,4-dihydroxy-2-naphthoyl-CoA hydrolase [Alteromonadaceae bacterium Bs31]